jgi:hypothetical protein
MAVTITCTKKDGTTITAKATSDLAVTWSLEVDGNPTGLGTTLASQRNGTTDTATFSNVPAGASYRVVATEQGKIGSEDSQSVPFGSGC